jgi:type II secretory pathway component PulC
MKTGRPIQWIVLLALLVVLAVSFFAFWGTQRKLVSYPEIQIEVPQEWASTYADNITPLLTAARVVPYLDEKTGKMVGLRVMHTEPNSPLQILAIQDSDILVQVEDVVFNEPAKGLQALQAVRGKSKVTLIVERAGKRQAIIYSVK